MKATNDNHEHKLHANAQWMARTVAQNIAAQHKPDPCPVCAVALGGVCMRCRGEAPTSEPMADMEARAARSVEVSLSGPACEPGQARAIREALAMLRRGHDYAEWVAMRKLRRHRFPHPGIRRPRRRRGPSEASR